jgi:hypothetical protein
MKRLDLAVIVALLYRGENKAALPLRRTRPLWIGAYNSTTNVKERRPILSSPAAGTSAVDGFERDYSDHGHFKSNRLKVTNVIAYSMLALDRTENRKSTFPDQALVLVGYLQAIG